MENQRKQTREDAALASYSIGLKLRTLRSQKRLTLSQLAAETELSTALLSKLESDRMIPTLPTLARICRVYGIGLHYFFGVLDDHSIAVTRRSHVVEEKRGFRSLKTIPLHVSSAEDDLIARIIDFPPDMPSRIEDGRTASQLVAYIIDGSIELNLAGMKKTLRAGDCAVLNKPASAIWSAASSHCRVLVVTAHKT